jgi:hypothetical protein
MVLGDVYHNFLRSTRCVMPGMLKDVEGDNYSSNKSILASEQQLVDLQAERCFLFKTLFVN